jgi:hypothetical protein
VQKRFTYGGRDGWRTDRGRVFLALGEPESIRRVPGGVEALEKEIWSYGGSAGADAMRQPSGSGGADPTRQFVFYRCGDGTFRLDPSCGFVKDPTSVAFDTERADFIRKVRDMNGGSGLRTMLNKVLLPVPGAFRPPLSPR